ncbi:uncharacterized protein N7511_009291 [Penicillium nucicola]|uniref:uncharacterized protein n=1 Tax=Penicillium nucicola TaxID=1850975 RepID=UPI0025452FF2|nr:uncharacterized protein N7511_009291 [Penicillium nucicola]KAJ5747595.1 hypothetical protein N7511_009291 [Penicillium nucicola]
MEQISGLLATGEEVLDVEEESFVLFAQDIPTNNLGMIDSRAQSVEVSIHGNEYTINQSPALLSGHRAGGTTGAVLWKITPLFSEWITSPTNPLWTTSFLNSSSTIVELGTGISALLALTLSPSVQHYIATDQEYVQRLFRTNLEANASIPSSAGAGTGRGSSKSKSGKGKGSKISKSKTVTVGNPSNISFTTLDWETDQPGSLKQECMPSETSHPNQDIQGGDADEEEAEDRGFDVLLSCDCIYNEALVSPFVRTCAEICRLRPVYDPTEQKQGQRRPTICIIAQQQRSPDVFETWLRETLREFRVWRLSDDILGEGLKSGTGYLVHLLLVR